jgi:hypothetical protein
MQSGTVGVPHKKLVVAQLVESIVNVLPLLNEITTEPLVQSSIKAKSNCRISHLLKSIPIKKI